ncbi:MAG: YceI family protein [Firmicutes bacterium]|nr:YceI family protein [Bacillota bacterium]
MSNTSRWVIEPTHSLVEFTVRHMMIANVKGRFSEVEGEVIGDPHDLTGATIQVSINTASVDTRVADRDNHLRSADFFDSENYPQMTFKSTKITKTGEGEYRIDGELTIRDVTNPITLEATFEGAGKDPWGGERAGFSAKGKLNRKDYGLTWNAALETGGVLVSDEVKINIEVELLKQE